jgi:urease accessory protein
MIESASELLIWQLADSAFPSGGFPHSSGLEAARHQGVADADSLSGWLRAQIGSVARASLPFVFAAMRGFEDFAAIDADCDLFLNNHVANRASRLQGQSLLQAAAAIFDGTMPQGPELRTLRERIRQARQPGHLAPVFGTIAKSVGCDSPRAARLYLFILLRGQISAAVRLGIVGPMEGQKIQLSLLPEIERLASNAEANDDSAPAQISPLMDLLQQTHDRLYTRLFRS